MAEMAQAFTKMQNLSEERAARVISLIDDLADLEARENAEDIAAAEIALEEYRKTGEAISLDDLEKELGL